MNTSATSEPRINVVGDRLFRVHEAAELLSISPRMVAMLVKDRKLRPTRIGRCLRFHRADIDEFVERSKAGDSREFRR